MSAGVKVSSLCIALVAIAFALIHAERAEIADGKSPALQIVGP